MSHFEVSPHIGYCSIDDGIVVLDMKTEKYVAIPPECRRAFELVMTGLDTSEHAIEPEIEHGLHLLVDGGLVTESPRQSHAPGAAVDRLAYSDSAMARMRDIRRPSISLRDMAAFLISLVIVGFQLHCRPFEAVIESVRRKRQRFPTDAGARDANRVRELFRIFRWQRLWTYTATDACLFDSLVLVTFLRHYGVVATLALGVQTKPFGAHAWAQWRDLVLNDTVEHVSRYTPILVV